MHYMHARESLRKISIFLWVLITLSAYDLLTFGEKLGDLRSPRRRSPGLRSSHHRCPLLHTSVRMTQLSPTVRTWGP